MKVTKEHKGKPFKTFVRLVSFTAPAPGRCVVEILAQHLPWRYQEEQEFHW